MEIKEILDKGFEVYLTSYLSLENAEYRYCVAIQKDKFAIKQILLENEFKLLPLALDRMYSEYMRTDRKSDESIPISWLLKWNKAQAKRGLCNVLEMIKDWRKENE